MKAPKTIPNNNDHAGRPASDKVTFGPWHRYCVYAIHTRFDNILWFVTDAEKIDALGYHDVIRQEDTFDAAIAGLI
jgi:hypothetical protein